jgi:NhaA family Na+:H+ antiporter
MEPTEPSEARTPFAVLPARSLPRAVRAFVGTEAAGGIVLVVAAVVALAWANSPWDGSYTSLWTTRVTFRVGTVGVDEDLRHAVNDGLMALFFLVVGLEIKRELAVGDLREIRTASLPIVAALGGMVTPAAVYLAVNAGEPGTRGWGIPMATDIAFALGVLALLGSRVPASLKLFLLTLAIVDDVGAITVIAVFYSENLDAVALGVALAALAGAIGLRLARVWWPAPYIGLGLACWLATYQSGVHATLAGVAFGLIAPARPLAPAQVAREWAQDLADEPSATEMRQMMTMARETVSVTERLEELLHPVTSFVVVPVFALANAGVPIGAGAFDAPGTERVAAGVALGLLAGKVLGITGACALAVRLGVARLPEAVTWLQIAGVATVAGIGFTVSLFIGDLAFDDAALADAARLAVLVTSVVAAAAGLGVLRLASWVRGSSRPAG